jgi:dTDP-glucose 4,6-dehydratase
MSIISDKRILITGGFGFIGSHLVESLIKNNKICIIDNEYRGSNSSYLKKQFPEDFKKIKYNKLDITNQKKLKSAIKSFKPEIIFHLAGIAGVSTVVKNPMKVIDVNLIGSYNLAKSVSDIKSVKKIIYTSTSEVYGNLAFQLSEDDYTTQGSPYDQRWSYATSKLFAEHIFVALEKESGIKVAIPRLFNIYGPRQIGSGAIHEFIKNSVNNKPLTLYNDGSQIRAWCYIDDCINALHLITKKGNGIFNIGNPYESLSTTSLANLILDITKSKSKLIFKKLNTTDIRLRVPNIEKLSKLGYRPKFPIRMGLSNTFEWYSNSLKINS